MTSFAGSMHTAVPWPRGMGDLGIQPHVVEAVLNYVSGHKAGVAGIYNKNTYEPEKRSALERWAEHVAVMTTS